MNLPLNTQTVDELYQRLQLIENDLKDLFISLSKTERLHQERAEIKKKLHELGYAT